MGWHSWDFDVKRKNFPISQLVHRGIYKIINRLEKIPKLPTEF